MWSDQETAVDLVNYAGIARTIVGLICNARLSPLTIGIHGDWGSGKSSVLEMVRTELAGDKRYRTLVFNGWLFQGFEDAKIAMMESVVAEVRAAQPLDEILKDKAAKLLKRVDWLKVSKLTLSAAWTLTTGIPGMIPGAEGNLLKPSTEPTIPEEIHAFRKEFRDLLETAKIDKLVVFIDDLDRCLPQTAIETLEALRLLLFVEGTVFVIAADEAMIEYAVRRHFPNLPSNAEGPTSFSRSYLEKLIQIPFRLPPMNRSETKRYISLLLASQAFADKPQAFTKLLEGVREKLSTPLDEVSVDAALVELILGEPVGERLREALLMADRISSPLAEGLKGNPRQIKRFLNTLVLRMQLASAYKLTDSIREIKLAKLMLVERLHEPAYNAILESCRSSANGRSEALKKLETVVRVEDGGSENRPTSKTENGRGGLSEHFTPLLDSEWFKLWLKMEPSLGEDDLRPYFYVSREGKPGLVGLGGIPAELGSIIETLKSGETFKIAKITQETKNLSHDDASMILTRLLVAARESEDWDSQPATIKGAATLVGAHPKLQLGLLRAFENMPIASMGVWAPLYLRRTMTTPEALAKLGELEAKWEAQTENTKLRQGVIEAKQLGKSRQ